MSRPIGIANLPSPPTITLSSRLALGGAISRMGVGAAASGISPWSDAADFVLAFPFVLEAPSTTFYKGFWVNGTAAGGNSDVAIYDEAYSLITSTGSVGGTGNSVPQAAALGTTVTLPPGRYYAGMSHSATTTNQLFRWSIATTGIAFWMAAGCWKFSDNVPISSATATPADLTNVAFPVFGLITRSAFDV
jgi:hypothetical protein